MSTLDLWIVSVEITRKELLDLLYKLEYDLPDYETEVFKFDAENFCYGFSLMLPAGKNFSGTYFHPHHQQKRGPILEKNGIYKRQ